MKNISFESWWFEQGSQEKAEAKFGFEAEKLCNETDPNIEIDNLYTDMLEKLAKADNMHLQ